MTPISPDDADRVEISWPGPRADPATAMQGLPFGEIEAEIMALAGLEDAKADARHAYENCATVANWRAMVQTARALARARQQIASCIAANLLRLAEAHGRTIDPDRAIEVLLKSFKLARKNLATQT